jgi:hypothetical protein
MKIRIWHLWVPAAVLYVLAIIMAFWQLPVMAAVLTIAYLSLLVGAKWAHD